MTRIRPGMKTAAQLATDPALRAALESNSRARHVPGRRFLFAGDSHTDGANASNGSTTSFRALTKKIVGGARMSTVINGGVPGNTSAQLLARMDSLLAQSPDAVFVLIGTNDCGVTPLATYQANIAAIKAKCDAAGRRVAFGTIPPRAAGATSAIKADVRRFNLWLTAWCANQGIPLADINSAVADKTTGNLAAANDSGDGIHMNDAGHLAAANAIAVVVPDITSPLVWPVRAAGNGLLLNPLPTATAQWGTQAGPGTALSSIVAPAAGELPGGSWLRWTLNNSAGGSQSLSTFGADVQQPFAAGDVLLVCAYVRASSAIALSKLGIFNKSGGALISLLLDTPPSATPGPVVEKFTVPAGVANMYLGGVIQAGAGLTTTYDIGAVDVFNLTASGIDPALF
jgi:lysophospholipase L1-like esterase